MTATAGRVVAQVQDELRALWSTSAPTSASTSAPNPAMTSRSCTMNLVVVAPTRELAERWIPLVDEVAQSVPSRAIVVGLDPDGNDGLEASVAAVCTPGGGESAICSERITLVAHGGLCARLPSCVDALCAPDVSTTLVWLARVHGGDPAFGPLAREASRIVLDASQSSLGSLAHVVRWTRERPADDRPGIADLVWTRIAQWQELCARVFDAPQARELAARVTRLSISQASAPGSAVGPEGALLLGWLATSLGWQASSLAGRLRLLRPDGGYLHVQLRAKPSSDAPRGALLGVEIEAADGESKLLGQIDHTTEAGVDGITWRLTTTTGGSVQRMERRTRFRANPPERLLQRTLRRPRHDEALAAAAVWADELRGEEVACDDVDAVAAQR